VPPREMLNGSMMDPGGVVLVEEGGERSEERFEDLEMRWALMDVTCGKSSSTYRPNSGGLSRD